MEEKLEVLRICPMKKPKRFFITDSLRALQQAVGGRIEQFSNFDDDAVIICNEEGKINGLPLNRAIYGKDGKLIDIIVGDFIICRAPFDSDTYASLTPEQFEKYELRFRYPEKFYKTFDGIRVMRQKERPHDVLER